jgi:hypothetical protein
VLLGAVLRALGDFTEDDGVRVCALRALAGLAHGGALTTQQVNQQVLGAVLSVLNADFHNSTYDVEASCLEVLRELAPFLRSSPRAAETVRAILKALCHRNYEGPHSIYYDGAFALITVCEESPPLCRVAIAAGCSKVLEPSKIAEATDSDRSPRIQCDEALLLIRKTAKDDAVAAHKTPLET